MDDKVSVPASSLDPEMQKEFEDAYYILGCLEDYCELSSELMVWFIRGLREGKSVTDAINNALCEWDLI